MTSNNRAIPSARASHEQSRSVSAVPVTVPIAAVREHHGCACRKGDVKLSEMESAIKIAADFHAELEPAQARYIARKLYHLARKIERRSAAVIEARRATTLGVVHESTGAAQTPSEDNQDG